MTDVGNDILYGFSVERTLGWVEEVLVRLVRVTQDIVLTDLPIASVSQLSNSKFLALRSTLVPSCRLSLNQVMTSTERVNEGFLALSKTYGAKFFHLDPVWYGFDPIHIRPSCWCPAWQQILGVGSRDQSVGSPIESVRLYFMRPERRWLFGVEQRTPQ